jgi:putative mRNA 3-end processing factor
MKSAEELIAPTESGLYCRAGGFHIDPAQPVERAVITHAHADHARPGCRSYLATPETARLIRARLGPDTPVEEAAYGEPIAMNGVRLSLHPAGHMLGSAQVRLERGGEVWVVTGDFKREPDPTCAAFEPLRAHGLVIESTFGLPVFRWPAPEAVFEDIRAWWRRRAEAGGACVLFAYAAGKAQRILASLGAAAGPVYAHGAVENMNRVYRAAGVRLPPTRAVVDGLGRADFEGALVIAPPSAGGSPWIRRLPAPEKAFASGWMQIRGMRRRRALERGFVVSDHADWSGLVATVLESGAERVRVSHGYSEELARFLRDKGLAAQEIRDGTAAGGPGGAEE